MRSFITTQSVKQLPGYLKEFALDPEGWHIIGSKKTYNINELDEDEFYDEVFYKDRWIKEDLSGRKIRKGAKPLEQHLIVSFSIKYRNYQAKIRQGQIDRAQELIDSGKYKQRPKNQNDPHRFIAKDTMTEEGEVCKVEVPYLNTDLINEEEKYDGFYAVCTNLDKQGIRKRCVRSSSRWSLIMII